ncbi:MAG: hypothetical protein U5K69_11220 [Balneolaceae bacterium]|nr:hypothetical protein [Balneolaceae bacterium]
MMGSMQTMSSLIWIVWSFFIAYFVKIEHPPALIEKPLGYHAATAWLA